MNGSLSSRIAFVADAIDRLCPGEDTRLSTARECLDSIASDAAALLAACKLYHEYATGQKSDELLTDNERQRMENVHRGYTGPIIVERMEAVIRRAEAAQC